MKRLAEVLRRWRRGADLSIREAASQIGTSPATLGRIEKGELMDGKTLAKILRWLTE